MFILLLCSMFPRQCTCSCSMCQWQSTAGAAKMSTRAALLLPSQLRLSFGRKSCVSRQMCPFPASRPLRSFSTTIPSSSWAPIRQVLRPILKFCLASAPGCSAGSPWSSKLTETPKCLAIFVLAPPEPSLSQCSALTFAQSTDGQLSDLLALFREHGFPSNRSGGDVELASYVFNGDFVDRGAQQVEVVALLFSLKVCFPDRVFLVRGNHEFRSMNMHMTAGSGNGFDAACDQFFGCQIGPVVFESIHRRAPGPNSRVFMCNLKTTRPFLPNSHSQSFRLLIHNPFSSAVPLIGCLLLLSSKIRCLFFTGASASECGRTHPANVRTLIASRLCICSRTNN